MNYSSAPPLVHVAESSTGRGLFAGEQIAIGTCVLEFSGPTLTLNETRAKGPAAANALQIGIDRYIYLDEPGRFVNHSCSPNAAVIDNTRLVAIRPIAAGEEIRFDYSTTVSDGWTMECRCGAAECRGLVAAFQLLPELLRRRYALLGHVQRFIIEQVEA
jgi:SET domain-containing protein